jgi:hypothetical protein
MGKGDNMIEITANQRTRIDAARFIADNIDAIDRAFPEATLRPENSTSIQHAHSVLEYQLARIAAKSAKYAVVGLEKAGKSTFLNALIGLDVLPTRGERCTYAITSLRASKGPFQLTIRPKLCSISQFKAREGELEQAAKMPGPIAKAAAEDLAKLKAVRPQLEALISGKQKPRIQITDERFTQSDFEFSDKTITDIDLARACLKAVVATPEIAFAVKDVEVEISSPHLQTSSDGGFELIDLPGLDSGLTIHRELAEVAMANADAIIFVQNISNPSLQEHARTLLSYANQGDVIEFREKIFVFLNRADEKTDAVVNDGYDSAAREWRKNEVDAMNIFVGSAAGQLLLTPGELSKETLATFLNTDALRSEGDISTAAANFRQGLKESMSLYNRRVKGSDDTGFGPFVARLEEFRQSKQAVNAAKRIDESLRKIKNSSRDFVQTLNSKLKNQSRIFDVSDLDDEIVFQGFLENYVNSAQLLVLDATRGITGRDPEQSAGEYDIMVREKVNEIFDRLYYLVEENIDEIARPHKGGQRDVIEFQMTWRKLLYQEIENALRGLGDEIGSAISGEITEVLDHASQLIFRNAIVEKTLIGTRDTYDAEVKASVNALLMQFSRPLIISAIRPLPLNTTDTARSDALAQYRRELKAFSQFYTGQRTEFADAYVYIAGEESSVAAASRGKSANGGNGEKPPSANGLLDRFKGGSSSPLDASQKPKPVEDHRYDAPFERAKEAVRKDIDLCRELLSNSLARAAGLSAFRLAQFETLDKRFRLPDSKNRWKGAIQKARKTAETKADVERVFSLWRKERTQYDEHLAAISEVLKHYNEL